MVEVICVDPKRVEEIWPRVADMIDAAYAASDELMPDLSDEFRSRMALLWIVWDGQRILAALVTRLLKYRSGLVCKVVACGGSGLKRRTFRLLSTIETYAKAEGCTGMVIDGRNEWASVFPQYRQTGITLRKSI